MTVISILLGLLAPMAVGLVLTRLILIQRARLSLVVGAGGLLGLIGAAAFMLAWGTLGLPFLAMPMLGIWCAALVGSLVWARRCQVSFRDEVTSSFRDVWQEPLWQRLILLALLIAIATHVVLVGIEVVYRPLYPFDATTAWATKAKVWAYAGELTPFVSKAEWLADTSGMLFTDHRPDYPIVTPLLQLWMAVLAGGWHLSLVNLPWFGCFAVLLLLFYGGARDLGLNRLAAAGGTYLVASMPLINTHVALAGYADLFMCSVFLSCVVFMMRWIETRDIRDLSFLLLFAVVGPLVKNEGLFWSFSLLPGLIVGVLPARIAWTLILIGVALAAGVLALFPGDLSVAGHSLNQLGLAYRPDAVWPVLQSLFSMGSWHLTYYVVLMTAVFFWQLNVSVRRALLPLVSVLITAHCLLLVLFLFTGYAQGAIFFTAVNRINMAIVPATMLITVAILFFWQGGRNTLHASKTNT